jgi:hypothetical protein
MHPLRQLGELSEADAQDVFETFDTWTSKAAFRAPLETGDVFFALNLVRRFDLSLRAPDAANIAIAQRHTSLHPEAIVTNGLCSCGSERRWAARTDIGQGDCERIIGPKNSHLPVRRRERKMQRFKSQGSAQKFVATRGAVYNSFNVPAPFDFPPNVARLPRGGARGVGGGHDCCMTITAFPVSCDLRLNLTMPSRKPGIPPIVTSCGHIRSSACAVYSSTRRQGQILGAYRSRRARPAYDNHAPRPPSGRHRPGR